MTFLDYDKIFLFTTTKPETRALCCYWEVNEDTVRYKFESIDNPESKISRISDCSTIKQVYKHYNPRFLCLK